MNAMDIKYVIKKQAMPRRHQKEAPPLGLPGARLFRRHLSENATRPGAGLPVLRDALSRAGEWPVDDLHHSPHARQPADVV